MVKPVYEDIHMPKDSGMGIYIAAFSLVFGFAIVWHILWLVAVGLVGIVVWVIISLSNDDTGYTVTAEEIARIEAKRPNKRMVV